MSSSHSLNSLAQPFLAEDWYQVPHTFAESIAYIKTLALQDFDREVAEKQLCYHTREHIIGVQRRATQIFQVIRPYVSSLENCDRLAFLLDLCAVTHDLVQVFVSQIEPHTTRRREAGISETATIERIVKYIEELHQAVQNQNFDGSVLFIDSDLHIIQEAIAATICDYDPTEQAIYQPALYNQERSISPVARSLALADIGTLGIEGIEAYNLEGSLLFLEENPDVRSLIDAHKLDSLDLDDSDLHENIRQRLLRRARFQVSFAKSRLNRFSQELEGFPFEAIPLLMQQVFRYLTLETIETIASTTPTAEDTSLQELIQFFRFDQVIVKPEP